MENRGPEEKGRMRAYWRRLMESTRKKMSLGAQYITSLMSKPHGDSWRRRDEVKKHKK